MRKHLSCIKDGRLALAAAPARVVSLIILGGETTVTVRGDGRGGRNAEFLLSLGITLNRQADTWAIAYDTDYIGRRT